MGELSGKIEHRRGLADPTLLVRTHDDWRVGTGWVLSSGIHARIVAGGGYGGVFRAVFHVEQPRLGPGVRRGACGGILSQ
jgi:hypothetical protein